MRRPQFGRGPRTGAFTLVELLVVIAIIATLAGLLVPTIMGARQRADRAVCLNNLKEMAKMAMLYAQDHKNILPVEAKNAPAYLSIQKLIDSQSGLKPGLFVCPASSRVEAEVDEKGKFVLEEDNCSYSWIGKKYKLSATGQALSSDDKIKDPEKGIEENHDKGLNVVFIDTTAEWWPMDRLPEGSSLPGGLVDNEGEGGD